MKLEIKFTFIENFMLNFELGESDDYIRLILENSQKDNNSLNYIYKNHSKIIML